MVDNEETGCLQRLLSVGKLQICKFIIYFVWLVNFVGNIMEAKKKPLQRCSHPQIFSCADIYIYYFILKEHMPCWDCLFRSYMIIALTVNALMAPLLIVGFFFIYSHLCREIRIVIVCKHYF